MTAVRERQPRHLQADEPRSLTDLAEVANREHDLCEQATRSTLEHAMAAGDALAEARATIAAGEWQSWLREHFTGSMDTARTYLRLATYREKITPGLTITAACDLLRGEDRSNQRGFAYSDTVRAAVVTAARTGSTVAEAAAAQGVPASTAQYWVNHKAEQKRGRENALRRDRERAALAAAERQKAIRAAVRKAGAALTEAYSMAERMGRVLSQACDEATTAEVRAELDEATADYHAMRDHVVRALGVC